MVGGVDVVVSPFVVLIAVVVVVVVGVVSAVGDGNHSLINLLIKGVHHTGGAEASCMECMRFVASERTEAPPPSKLVLLVLHGSQIGYRRSVYPLSCFD